MKWMKQVGAPVAFVTLLLSLLLVRDRTQVKCPEDGDHVYVQHPQLQWHLRRNSRRGRGTGVDQIGHARHGACLPELQHLWPAMAGAAPRRPALHAARSTCGSISAGCTSRPRQATRTHQRKVDQVRRGPQGVVGDERGADLGADGVQRPARKAGVRERMKKKKKKKSKRKDYAHRYRLL